MSSTKTPDSILVQQLASERSHEALEELIKRHSKMVYSVCYRVLQDTHWAEDVSQKVFLIFIEKAKNFPQDSILAGWLHRTALWQAKNLKRTLDRKKHYEMKAHLEQKGEAQHEEQWEEIKPHLDEAIETLPQKLRESVVLCFLKEKSQREAAKILGYSESTISRQLGKAISIMQSHFKQNGITLSAVALSTLLSTKTSEAIGPHLISNTLTTASTALTQTTFIGNTAITLITMKKAIATTALITGAITAVATYQITTTEKSTSEPTQFAAVQKNDGSKQKEIDRLKKEKLQQAARIIELESTLAQTGEELVETQEAYSEINQELDTLDNELLITYGTLEEAGKEFGSNLKGFLVLNERTQGAEAAQLTEQQQVEMSQKFGALLKDFYNMKGMFKGLKNLDSDPQEAASFQTSFYTSYLDLTPERQNQVQEILSNGYQQMKQAGLNAEVIPEEDEIVWKQRRKESYKQIIANVSQLLTPEENKIIQEKHEIFSHIWEGKMPNF